MCCIGTVTVYYTIRADQFIRLMQEILKTKTFLHKILCEQKNVSLYGIIFVHTKVGCLWSVNDFKKLMLDMLWGREMTFKTLKQTLNSCCI